MQPSYMASHFHITKQGQNMILKLLSLVETLLFITQLSVFPSTAIAYMAKTNQISTGSMHSLLGWTWEKI